MKTLNDYIKESILDDENVLITRAVKDVQNPFYLLSTLYNSTKDLKKNENKVIKILEEFLKITSLSKYDVDVYEDYIYINKASTRNHSWGPHTTYKALLYIRFDRFKNKKVNHNDIICELTVENALWDSKKFSESVTSIIYKYDLNLHGNNLILHKTVTPSNKNELEKLIEIAYDTWDNRRKGINLSYIDISRITDLSFLFYNKFKYEDYIMLAKWDVSHVTNMESMFEESNVRTYINEWNISNVVNMKKMFYNNRIFNSDISNWKISKDCNTELMFENSKLDDKLKPELPDTPKNTNDNIEIPQPQQPSVTPKSSSKSSYDKMKAWHDGTRKQNVGAMGDAKLKLSYQICKELGFEKEMQILKSEAEKRGIILENMKTLREKLNESLDLIEEGKVINKKQAVKIAQNLINSLDDYEMEENYDAVYDLLLDLATNCSDSKIKQIASDALDTDKDDMDDGLGVFVDALEKIKNF